jgi:cell division septum initiation protein DivIVA
MSVAEVILLQKQIANNEQVLDAYDKMVLSAKREAELELRETRVKADLLIKEAEFQAKKALEKKEKIERELKEFIQIEKELIKKYEDK